MKKTYITPAIRSMACNSEEMICISIAGLEGTSSFDTNVYERETDEALSRRKSFWDDEE